MAGKREKPEDIVSKLRQVEVLQGQGATIAEAVRQIGVTEQMFYRWRKLYGGMQRSQPIRLKELEKENRQQLIVGQIRQQLDGPRLNHIALSDQAATFGQYQAEHADGIGVEMHWQSD